MKFQSIRQELPAVRLKVLNSQTYTPEQQKYTTFMKDLLSAASSGNIDKMKKLVAINRQELHYNYNEWFLTNPSFKCTPLHIAAENNRHQIIEILVVEEKADINSQFHPEQKTPLHLVIDYLLLNPERSSLGYKTVIQAGADPLLKDWRGLTPLDYLENTKKALSPTLLEVKADLVVNAKERCKKVLELMLNSNEKPFIHLLNAREISILFSFLT